MYIPEVELAQVSVGFSNLAKQQRSRIIIIN